MTSFTFTSEDLEKVNKNKKSHDKIFPITENPRIAKGLMQEDGQTPDWDKKVKEQFNKDATRRLPVTFKQNDKSQVILNMENTGGEKEKVIPVLEKRVNSLAQKGLSPQQLNDFKFMTNQANIAATSELLREYIARTGFFDKDHNLFHTQNPNSILAQLEIRKSPPDNEERLIYRTGSKITFDKSTSQCNYNRYSTSASYDISSNDNILIIAEVDLGKLGDTKYTPKVTCSISAEGKNAEKILGQLSADIPSPSNSAAKSSEEIKAQYQDIVVKTLQDTGYEKVFKDEVKSNINLILSNNQNIKSIDPGELGALRAFKSTPKLFAEVLVERISEVNKIKDDKELSTAMQQLSENSQVFFDHQQKTSSLVENLSSSLRLTDEKQHNIVKSSFTALINDALNDLRMKNDIATLLNPAPDALYSIDVEALRKHDSTPKLFAEALVERISDINKIEDHKQREQAMKQLSDNAANFVDQPKGYMKILVNDTAREMAREVNPNLPKEGLISKISGNIKLMLAKINVKVRGKSEEVEKTKLSIIEARKTRQRSSGQSR